MDIIQLVRPNILRLEAYSSARAEFTGSASVYLDANENPYGTLNRYPDPIQTALKEAIGQWKGITTEKIFIGNGSDEIIDLCVRIFCRPGFDAVLSFTPSYGMYRVAAELNDVQHYTVPLNEQFQIDKDLLAPYLKDEKLKIIFVCSPNNPTGSLLEGIEELLEQFKGIVVVDEAYIDFAATNSWMEKLAQHPNLLVSQTLSKAGGLAGARIGIAYSSPAMIGLLNKVKPPYNVSTLNQAAALSVISAQKTIAEQIAAIISERCRLSTALSHYTFVRQVFPSEANFILICVDDAAALYTFLQEQGIIVRNRDTEIKGCLRISVGTTAENQLLLDALSNYSNKKTSA